MSALHPPSENLSRTQRIAGGLLRAPNAGVAY